MAKKVSKIIKLQIPAGRANPSPPVGTVLGPAGVNLMDFCNKYNEATKDKMGDIIPVEITVYEDKSFTFILKTPPVSDLLKKAANITKGSTKGKKEIIARLIEEYDIESATDIQDALADLLGGTIKGIMEAEMNEHLGYEKSQRSDSDNARNGYKSKRVRSSYGEFDIDVPQDRHSTFEPRIVGKRQKDIS